tara:strand:- start:8088 stop:8612 length:525 start_codon:yes stop_codon:yes gene_type:complete
MQQSNHSDTKSSTIHALNDEWAMWAHLPHDTDWTTSSYKEVLKIKSVEDVLLLTKELPDVLIENCMLFVMLEGIIPVWEDPRNRHGGCFSYKIVNKLVPQIWKDLMCMLVGRTISSNENFVNDITGITISPKKSFCIIKIWLGSCKYQDPELVTSEIKGLTTVGCLFKKHTPEY